MVYEDNLKEQENKASVKTVTGRHKSLLPWTHVLFCNTPNFSHFSWAFGKSRWKLTQSIQQSVRAWPCIYCGSRFF